MDRHRIKEFRHRNRLHTLMLLGGMLLPLAAAGSFFGLTGIVLAVIFGLTVFSAGRISPQWMLRMHRAQPIEPRRAPGLHQIVAELARRAEIPTPVLYRVPAPVINAFAVGDVRNSAIGVTDGLFRHLDRRELAAVLAHEISHIAHRDLRVMGLAEVLSRITRAFAVVGQFMLLLAIPLALTGQVDVPWIALMLMISAPLASALLQLALSRTREFEADLSAAELTGEPLALASALTKLENQSRGWLRRLLSPIVRPIEPTWLRSHPSTAERVARLRSLVPETQPRWRRLDPRELFAEPLMTYPVAARPIPIRIVRRPRWSVMFG